VRPHDRSRTSNNQPYDPVPVLDLSLSNKRAAVGVAAQPAPLVSVCQRK